MERIDAIAAEQIRIRTALQDNERQLMHLAHVIETVNSMHTRLETLEQWRQKEEVKNANLLGKISALTLVGAALAWLATQLVKFWPLMPKGD